MSEYVSMLRPASLRQSANIDLSVFGDICSMRVMILFT